MPHVGRVYDKKASKLTGSACIDTCDTYTIRVQCSAVPVLRESRHTLAMTVCRNGGRFSLHSHKIEDMRGAVEHW